MQGIKPLVLRKGGKKRYGRGFSREELKEAGLSLKEALKLKIPIDLRRKTKYKENVTAVKEFLKSKKLVSTSKKKRKSKN